MRKPTILSVNYLKRKNIPYGIFASMEKLAISTYEVCGEAKLNIPDDVKGTRFRIRIWLSFLTHP